ncbi:unnamed protein product [Gemmataceae bacterium]|nr:unnamed protein product [Gemmataceae bacterium]VTT98863.1 unnamed protein product [Gemmataceae bacterium]
MNATDDLIGLAQVCRNLSHMGRCGKPLSPSTLTRWITPGIRLRDGTRLRLQARRVGSKWGVRQSWVDEFLEAQTADRLGGDTSTPALRTPAERQRASDAAAAQLAAMGI